MLAQGLLDFQYEADLSSHGLTSLAGLPLYLDLIKACGLGGAIQRHVRAAGGQGWLDIQMVLAVIFLNLSGGDCVEDIERLERDSGFSAILRAIEKDLLSRAERRSLKSRWRRERERATPSPSALSGWLERFDDPASPKAVAGMAFIPAVTQELRGLWRVNQALLDFLQKRQPAATATLDMDATLIETHKREALFCYKKFKADQRLPRALGRRPHSRAESLGHVGADRELDHAKARVFSLAAIEQQLFLIARRVRTQRDCPHAVRQMAQAVFQDAQLLVSGGHVAVAELRIAQNGRPAATHRSGMGRGRLRAQLGRAQPQPRRLPLSRDPRTAAPTGAGRRGEAAVSHPGVRPEGGLFAVVTNRTGAGEGVIWWLRERCGKSEEVHSATKSDLAGGQMPSGLFGANAAWWALTILAFNLNAAMKRLALGERWAAKRMKALRFHLIGLPGRVVSHARQLIIRLGGGAEALATLLDARQRIRALAQEPAG